MDEWTQVYKDIKKQFPDEKKCINYLLNYKWPNGYRCPKCGYQISSYDPSRNLYRCRACNHQTSLTAGTLFHKTHTPLLTWFRMIMLIGWQYDAVNILNLQQLLEIKYYKQAWTMAHKIFGAMVSWDAEYLLVGLFKMDRFLIVPDELDRQPEEISLPITAARWSAGHDTLRNSQRYREKIDTL